MEIGQCYKILNVNDTARNEEISSAYKKLAIKYHPDKNRDKIQWANKAMTELNLAYSTLMSHRFRNEVTTNREAPKKNQPENKKTKSTKSTASSTPPPEKDIYNNTDEITHELFIHRFVKIRENAKDFLYKYFQYKLNNFALREKPFNMSLFNEIVGVLRKSYHSLNSLAKGTSDQEKIEHVHVFNRMIFNFYKASECINIIDAYKNQTEVDAYRSYKRGDDILHSAHKEIFFDRHNRGSFQSSLAYSNIIKAIENFENTLKVYPKSSWAVETSIKLEYSKALKKYVELFFTED
jgi:hypothetical protein